MNEPVDERILEVIGAQDLRFMGLPEGRQLSLLAEFVGLHSELGLEPLSGTSPAVCCRHGSDCWKHDPGSPYSSVSMPWVGSGYSAGGVVVMGMNLNSAFGAAVAFGLADMEAESFSRGQRAMTYRNDRKNRTGKRYQSLYAFRSTQAAGLAIDHLDQVEPRIRDAADLPAALDRIARLNLVQCSPQKTVNGAPYAAMWRNCTELLFLRQLDLLRPHFVLAFGSQPRRYLKPFTDAREVTPEGAGLWLAQITRPTFTTTLLMLHHPGAYGSRWSTGLKSLQCYLLEHPDQT